MDNGTQTGMGTPDQTQPNPTPAPAPAAGAPNQAPTPQPPQPQQPAAKPAPAPRAAAPPQKLGAGAAVNGVMSGIVMGALAGAAKTTAQVGRGIGRGLRNFAYNSDTAIAAREAVTRQAEAQQQMGLRERQMKVEEQRGMDEHQEAQLRSTLISMQNTHEAMVMQHLPEQLNNQDAASRLALQDAMLKTTQATTQFYAPFAQMGLLGAVVPVGEFDKSMGTSLGQGKTVALSTGDPKNPGVYMADAAQLSSTALPYDISVPRPVFNPKTGETTIEHDTMNAAGHTFMDALVAYQSNRDIYTEKVNAYTQQANLEAKQAEAEQKRGAAALSSAEAANLKNMGVNVPENYTPNPNALKMGASELMADMRSKGVQVPPDFQTLYAIGHYDSPIKELSTSTGRPGMPNRTQDQGNTFIRAFINPNFNAGNFDIIQNMKKEVADTKPSSAGGNLIAFNTATGHLGQLWGATQALKLQGNDQLKALNQIANRLGVETGSSAIPVFNAIRTALVGELGKTFKGTAADIPEREALEKSLNESYDPAVLEDVEKQYAHLMLSKSGALLDRYIGYTGELPPQAITPSAQRVYDMMGIDSSDIFQGAQVVPGRAPNMNVQQPNPRPAGQSQQIIQGGRKYNVTWGQDGKPTNVQDAGPAQ